MNTYIQVLTSTRDIYFNLGSCSIIEEDSELLRIGLYLP